MSTPAKEVIMDQVGMDRFRKFAYAASCEDCAHFDADPEKCTFGFPTTPHLRRNQLAQLEKDGRMAFCRTLEID